MKAALFAALILALTACGSPAGSRQAPDLVLPDLAGGTVNLATLRGKPVLVNFWATWCDSCRDEMPALEGIFRRAEGRYHVIGVSMDDNAALVPPFVKKYKLTFPIAIADRAAVAGYAVRGLPTAFLIDAEGRISRRWVGVLDMAAVENDILALINRRTE